MRLSSPRGLGRRAGVLWLLAAVSGGWALTYIRGHVYIAGDPSATAHALLANVTAFRLAIVCTLLSQLAMLFVALELFRLFAPFGRRLSRVLLVSMVASVVLACVNQLPNLVALLLLDSPETYLRAAFPQPQREALALLLLRIQNGPGQGLLEIFWTPYYVAFGWLVLRTRALPRLLGVLLIAMGAGFTINLVQKWLLPGVEPPVFTLLAMGLGALGAIPTMLWLIVRGVNLPARSTRRI